MKASLAKHTFPSTLVGLDVETTSLDPVTGEIIEFAAIRFDTKSGRVVDRFIELCQPSSPISAQITAITQITNDILVDKLPFSFHLKKLKQFIGHDPVFAHNASFDIGYLSHHGLPVSNPVWDTFVLASIAWPEASSYNLGLLYSTYVATDTAVPPTLDTAEQEHRAGYDVMLTWHLLQAIRAQLSVTPASFKKLEHVLGSAKISHYLPVFTAHPILKKILPPPTKKQITAPPSSRLTVAQILGPNGLLTRHPPFTYREQQLAMADAAMTIFNNKEIGLIEAGAGTGKTYGYLVPLLLRIVRRQSQQPAKNSSHVSILSTYTKHLQDQLFDHDLPQLMRLLNIDLKTAILKGRRNYLCTGRLAQALQKTSFSPDEALFLVKLIIWLEQTPSGDLECLNLSHQTARYLYHLHADSISCRHNCPTDNPTCPYNVARQKARQADLVIVNHALLVQLGLDDSAFTLDHTVIDEAHHLEAAARDATARDLTPHMLAEVMAPFVQLTKRQGQASRRHIVQEAQSIIDEYQQLLTAITKFLTDQARVDILRLNTSVRRSTKWQRIVEQGIAWRSRLQFIIGLMQGMSGKSPEDSKRRDAILEAEKFSQHFESFLRGDPGRIQWLELSPPFSSSAERTVTLQDVTLSVQPLLSNLFKSTASAILTSATLTIGQKYDYIKRRLGIAEAKEYVFGSPFDYKKQMLIYIVDDSPPPYDPAYRRYLSRQFIALSKLTSGRLLGLFTSHQSVKEVYNTTSRELTKANIKLLAQNITGGRHNMIKRFQQTHASTLLGTYSFWEGIDIPGESLSSVAIVKLPFATPHDPIIDAIAEDEKISTFIHLAVPTMILRLRQGIGRLIRSQTDFGTVVIFDSRFLRQDYGQQVINSLPPATVHLGSTNDLMPTLKNWFGDKQIKRWKSELEALV